MDYRHCVLPNRSCSTPHFEFLRNSLKLMFYRILQWHHHSRWLVQMQTAVSDGNPFDRGIQIVAIQCITCEFVLCLCVVGQAQHMLECLLLECSTQFPVSIGSCCHVSFLRKFQVKGQRERCRNQIENLLLDCCCCVCTSAETFNSEENGFKKSILSLSSVPVLTVPYLTLLPSSWWYQFLLLGGDVNNLVKYGLCTWDHCQLVLSYP